MSLTSSMLVGFSGIRSNTVTVDTVGNNLANMNTTAFKGQRTLFETQLYLTLSEGESPSDTSGGTLPEQIGYGSGVAAIQRDFGQGGVESTGFPTDLALDGEGFFILDNGDGRQVYTRDGAFRLDATNTLVATNGSPVQVFGVDGTGEITPGTLTNLVVPLGTASEAIATTSVIMDGRLDAGTELATGGAESISQALTTGGGAAATASTPLTDLMDATGLALFATDDVLTIDATKGGVSIQTAQFVVGTDGATLGDLGQYLESALGINTDPITGGSPGVTIADGTTHPAGTLVVASNLGDPNAINLDTASITNTTGVVRGPFSFSTSVEAAGGGESTSFGVFDSLGNKVDVRVRTVLESRSDGATTWRYYAESINDTDLSPMLGTGTITFDANGQFVAATGTDLSIDRAGTGAGTPLSISLDFSGLTGLVSAEGESEIIMASQDGAPAGILTNFSIDQDGMVTGVFSNTRERVYGQIALATFVNEEGLLALSDNNYDVGASSGGPTIQAPRTGNAGAVIAGTLERSNVEIAREFVNLITASTGVSAASRVVRVADDLLQELLLLAR